MFERLLSDKQVEQRYVDAGAGVGEAISYIAHIGRGPNQHSIKRWARWEKEYARRGYRTISTDSFVSYGGYDQPIEGLGVKRAENEAPKFYASERSKV